VCDDTGGTHDAVEHGVVGRVVIDVTRP